MLSVHKRYLFESAHGLNVQLWHVPFATGELVIKTCSSILLCTNNMGLFWNTVNRLDDEGVAG